MTTPLVFDSSAVVEMLLATTRGTRIKALAARHGGRIHLPELCPVEVVSAVRGLVAAAKLGASRASAALDDFSALNAKLHSARPMLARIWHLRDNLTAHDATYVVLAERLEAPLITSDAKFDTASVRRLIAVEVIR